MTEIWKQESLGLLQKILVDGPGDFVLYFLESITLSTSKGGCVVDKG